MMVIGYTSVVPGAKEGKSFKFDDNTNPHIKRKRLIESLHVLSKAFCLPSDCVWIVPGTEELGAATASASAGHPIRAGMTESG